MILAGETNANGREVPFYLPQASNPALPLTGHTFTTGEVKYLLSGGSYSNVTTAALIERGYGAYAYMASLSDASVGGDILLSAVVSGAQSWTGYEQVTRAPGGIVVGETSDPARSILFHLSAAADGSAITSHTWTTGELKIRIPGSSWVNADITRVTNLSNGDYSLALTSPQVVGKGKVYLAIDLSVSTISSAQQMTTWADIVTQTSLSPSPPAVMFSSPTPNTTPGSPGGFPADYNAAEITPIIVQVTDPDGAGALAYIAITVSLQDGSYETAYRAGAFTTDYAGSLQVSITNGVQLTLTRVAGWPAALNSMANLAVTLIIDVIDSGGIPHSFQASYELPVTSGISPPPPMLPILTARDVVTESLSRIIYQWSSAYTGDTVLIGDS